MSDDEEVVRQGMSALARRKHAALTPEQRSAAASHAAHARHDRSTAAQRKALGKQLAEARAAARLKKRAVPKKGQVRNRKDNGSQK